MASKRGRTWQVGRQDWIALEPGEMKRMLTSDSTDLVTRVLIANWWMELDSTAASSALVQLGRTLRDGQLLAVCLALLSQQKTRPCVHTRRTSSPLPTHPTSFAWFPPATSWPSVTTPP